MSTKNKYILLLIISIVSSLSCDNADKKPLKSYPSDLPVIDLRGLIQENKKEIIPIFSPDDKIEYVPLKDYPEGVGFQDVLVTETHIYVILSHYLGLLVYDREGNLLKQHEEPGFHLFELVHDKQNSRVFASGWSNTWILDEKTGEPLGDAQTIYHLPAHSVVYPLSSNRLLTLYGKEDTHYSTKVGASICGYDGSRLTDSVYIGKGNKELHACWWSWSTFVMEDGMDDYLFFTFFRNAPFQTIYRTTPEGIKPAYYLDIEPDTDIRYAWKTGDSLCFIYHLLCQGYILVPTNITLAIYNMKTGELKSQQLLNKMPSPESNCYLGISNTIDNTLPIQMENVSERNQQICYLLTGKNVQAYLQKEKIRGQRPDFIRTMNTSSDPVVVIINYLHKK